MHYHRSARKKLCAVSKSKRKISHGNRELYKYVAKTIFVMCLVKKVCEAVRCFNRN